MPSGSGKWRRVPSGRVGKGSTVMACPAECVRFGWFVCTVFAGLRKSTRAAPAFPGCVLLAGSTDGGRTLAALRSPETESLIAVTRGSSSAARLPRASPTRSRARPMPLMAPIAASPQSNVLAGLTTMVEVPPGSAPVPAAPACHPAGPRLQRRTATAPEPRRACHRAARPVPCGAGQRPSAVRSDRPVERCSTDRRTRDQRSRSAPRRSSMPLRLRIQQESRVASRCACRSFRHDRRSQSSRRGSERATGGDWRS